MATIRKKGSNYQALIRRAGFPQQSKTFPTKKRAQAWARDIEGKMDRGHYFDQSLARTTTYADLIEIYLTEVTNHRPSKKARESEASRLKRFLREEPKISFLTMDKLQAHHFESYRDRRLASYSPSSKLINGERATLSPSTVKREFTTLKGVIDYQKRKLGLLINPINTEDVKRPAVNDERNVRLSTEEKERLLEACRAMRNRLIAPCVELGFETGARQGNLLRLEWSDVDLVGETALLRRLKNSKNPHVVINHGIGLSPRAIEILKGIPKTEDRVLPITANALRLSFNRARKKANLEHFRFHDTRHERISNLFEAGWTMMQVMAQTGHRDPKSVKRYANLQANFLAKKLAEL